MVRGIQVAEDAESGVQAVEILSVKRVYTGRHPTDAHMLADLLVAEGIPAATQGTNYGGRAHIWDRPSVWIVEDSDLDRAMKFIEEYSRRESPEGAATWQCPTCREDIEEQFSSCWKCDFPRPDDDVAPR